MYRIKNWSKIYETSETRKLNKLQWLPLRNDFGSTGYSQLMANPGTGYVYFSVFTVCLQVASLQDKPRDGSLLRGDGSPHTITSLAAKTRLPAKVLEDGLRVLVDEIGWVEWVESQSLPEPAAVAGRVSESSADSSNGANLGSPATPASHPGTSCDRRGESQVLQKQQPPAIAGEPPGVPADRSSEGNRRERKGRRDEEETIIHDGSNIPRGDPPGPPPTSASPSEEELGDEGDPVDLFEVEWNQAAEEGGFAKLPKDRRDWQGLLRYRLKEHPKLPIQIYGLLSPLNEWVAEDPSWITVQALLGKANGSEKFHKLLAGSYREPEETRAKPKKSQGYDWDTINQRNQEAQREAEESFGSADGESEADIAAAKAEFQKAISGGAA